MKVKLTTRQVYNKIAEVEIDIPDMKEEEVADYLIENENLYTDKIDKKVSEAEYNYGFGLGNGMDERDVVEEWRFNVDEKKYEMSTFNLQYPKANMRYLNEDGNTRFVTDFKGFTMLRAVSMYSTNDMCKGRAMVYLDEAIDVDVKTSMRRGEGSFMST